MRNAVRPFHTPSAGAAQRPPADATGEHHAHTRRPHHPEEVGRIDGLRQVISAQEMPGGPAVSATKTSPTAMRNWWLGTV